MMGGANAWHHEASWPPASTALHLYLNGAATAAAGEATSAPATHRLERTAPTESAAATEYVSDPANRVHLRDVDKDPNYGAYDMRELGARSDVVTFETPTLTEDLDVRGRVGAKIYLSVDAPDVDLAIKVVDVDENGNAWSLLSPAAEMLRASSRDGGATRKLMTSGEVVTLDLPNLVTANRFAKGHKIRVYITSSFYPAVSPNLQTGKDEATSSETRRATVRILHDREHASEIILPTANTR